MTTQKRLLRSFAYGALITVVLTAIAFSGDSRRWVCTFAWQGCAVMRALRAPDMPDGSVREGTPADPIFFFLGVSLGVPIYGGLTYAALTLTDKSRK